MGNIQPSDTLRKRPSLLEGENILEAIVAQFTLDYVAKGFSVSKAAVSKWMGTRRDIFSRMRSFVRDLHEDGMDEQALNILRYLCSAIGYIPVQEPARKVSLDTLLRTNCGLCKESAETQIAFNGMIEDTVLSLSEIIETKRQAKEQQERLCAFIGQLEFLEIQAKESDGVVYLYQKRTA